MKKLYYSVFVIALTATTPMCYAQDEGQETEKEVRNASTAIREKKYMDAIYSLDNAKKMVVELVSSEVAAALPVKVENWVYEDKPAMDMCLTRSQSRINVVKHYVKEAGKPKAGEKSPDEAIGTRQMEALLRLSDPSEPLVTVTVTDDFSFAVEVSQAHSGEENTGGFARQGNGISEPIKVKGYRALLAYNPEIKYGSLTIIAGASVVRIEGKNIEAKEILQSFANAVDYTLIKSILGE